MPETAQPVNYEPALRAFRRRQIQFLVFWIGGFGLCVLELYFPFMPKQTGFWPPWWFWLGAPLMPLTVIRLKNALCPRCSERIAVKWGVLNPFTWKCRHCGLVL